MNTPLQAPIAIHLLHQMNHISLEWSNNLIEITYSAISVNMFWFLPAHILFKHSCIKHLALNIRENSDLTPKATADLDDNFLILPISFQLKFHQNMLGQEKKNIIE